MCVLYKLLLPEYGRYNCAGVCNNNRPLGEKLVLMIGGASVAVQSVRVMSRHSATIVRWYDVAVQISSNFVPE